MSRRVSKPQVVKRCKKWLAESVTPDAFDRVDWDSEIDPTLSFDENVNLLLEKFPEAFERGAVDDYYRRVKQIVFIPALIELILRGEVTCTYRTTPKHGYYYVMHSRFVKSYLKTPACVIEVHRTEPVDPYALKDEDARPSLGPDGTADRLRTLFRRWYGEPLPKMWRNWFTVKENLLS